MTRMLVLVKSNGDTVDDDFGGGNANDNVDDDDFEIYQC